jgi:ferredoxin--NADP+ reductase
LLRIALKAPDSVGAWFFRKALQGGLIVFEILECQTIAPNSLQFRIAAPHIARKAQPGQFVVIRTSEVGERIPLTLADTDPKMGTITLVVQQVGKTTRGLGDFQVGDSLHDILGPLGIPSEIANYGTVVSIGGGFGVAATYPIARALKKAGNKVITIMGARTRELLLWEEKTRQISDELIITTDDGSYGRKGFVSQALEDLLKAGEKIDHVLAIGPVPMMRVVAETTRPYGVKTMVSLNPIMLDATGLCGVCRVSIANHAKFACVDGPEFDAHQVDWAELMSRLTIYKPEEKVALEHYEQHKCCGRCNH